MNIAGIVFSLVSGLYFWQYRSGERCFFHNRKSVLDNFCKYQLFQHGETTSEKILISSLVTNRIKVYRVVQGIALTGLKNWFGATTRRACKMGIHSIKAFDLHLQWTLPGPSWKWPVLRFTEVQWYCWKDKWWRLKKLCFFSELWAAELWKFRAGYFHNPVPDQGSFSLST